MSSYCWLEPVDGATSENDAVKLAMWTRVFTLTEIWVFDRGPHFKNNFSSALEKYFHIVHKPSVAYSPWANGTVESLMRSVFAALEAIMFELKLALQDQKEINTAIITIINSTEPESWVIA